MNLDPYDLNAFIAPKYDGLSHKTTSPSFKNTLPAKSNPCWEPLVISISSLVTFV